MKTTSNFGRLTDGQYNTMLVLSHNDDVSGVTFSSKSALRTLSKLSDKGMIDFKPFEFRAPLTSQGRAALAEAKAK